MEHALKLWFDKNDLKTAETVRGRIVDTLQDLYRGITFLCAASADKCTAEGESGPPVLVLHGWPSSVWEFHRIIPLADSDAAKS